MKPAVRAAETAGAVETVGEEAMVVAAADVASISPVGGRGKGEGGVIAREGRAPQEVGVPLISHLRLRLQAVFGGLVKRWLHQAVFRWRWGRSTAGHRNHDRNAHGPRFPSTTCGVAIVRYFVCGSSILSYAKARFFSQTHANTAAFRPARPRLRTAATREGSSCPLWPVRASGARRYPIAPTQLIPPAWDAPRAELEMRNSRLPDGPALISRLASSKTNIPRLNIQYSEYSGIFNENSLSKMGHFANVH